MISVKYLRSFLLLIVALCAITQLPAQTIESVMRALQERHMAVEQRKYVESLYGYVDPQTGEFDFDSSGSEEIYEAMPIDWGDSIQADYPEDGSLSGMSIEELINVLDVIRIYYNNLIAEYVYPVGEFDREADLAMDIKRHTLPYVGRLNENNYKSFILEISLGLSEMEYLEWPFTGQELINGAFLSGFEYYPLVGEGEFTGDESVEVGGFPNLLQKSEDGGFGYSYENASYWMRGENYVPGDMTNGDYDKLGGDDYTYTSIFALTGNGVDVSGKFYLVGRQMPTGADEAMELEKGEWPKKYEEFKGYKIYEEFDTSDPIIRYGWSYELEDHTMVVPPDASFATGHVSAKLLGEWHFYSEWGMVSAGATYIEHEKYQFFPISIAPEYEDWDYTESDPYGDPPSYEYFLSRFSPEYNRSFKYQWTDGLLLFKPSFEHVFDATETNVAYYASDDVGDFGIDFRRQALHINIGLGLSGVTEGYLGFSVLTDKSGAFDGFGSVVDLELMKNARDFEVKYKSDPRAIPIPIVELRKNANGLPSEEDPKYEWYRHPFLEEIDGKDIFVEVKTYGGYEKISNERYDLKLFLKKQGSKSSIPFEVIKIKDNGDSFSVEGKRKRITVYYSKEEIKEIDDEGNEVGTGRFKFLKFDSVLTEYFDQLETKVNETYSSQDYSYSKFINGDLVYSRDNYFVEYDDVKYDVFFNNIQYIDESGKVYPKAVNHFAPLYEPDSDLSNDIEVRRVEYEIITDAIEGGVLINAPEWRVMDSYMKFMNGPRGFTQAFDEYGRPLTRSEQFRGKQLVTSHETAGNTVTTEAHWGGELASKSERVWYGLTKYTDKVTADISSVDTLDTVTEFYDGAHPVMPWGIKSVVYPDGRSTTFDYSFASDQLTTTVTTGPVKSVTIINDRGHLVSSVTSESDVVIASVVGSDFDDWGRPTKLTYLDGTFIERTYAPDFRNLVIEEKDRSGAVQTYTYDGLGRLIGVAGDVDVEIVYDGFKRTATYSAGGETRSVSSTTNGFGELKSAYNEFEPATKTSVRDFVYTTKNEDTKETTVISTFSDGSISSISGSSVEPVKYEYGLENGMSFVQRSLVESGDSIFNKTYYDAVGRVRGVVSPAADGISNAVTQYAYEENGRLSKITDADGYETSFGYNVATGRMETATRGNRTYTSAVTYENGKRAVTASIGNQEISKVATNPATLESKITPFANSALTTTISRSLGSTPTVSINGPGGSAMLNYSNDWSLTGFSTKDRSGATMATSTVALDGFDRLTGVDSVFGAAVSSVDFRKNGLIDRAVGNGHTTNFNYSDGFKKLTATAQRGDVVIEANSKGELTKVEAPGVPTIELDHKITPSGIVRTLETAANGAKTNWDFNAAGALADKEFAGGDGPGFTSTAGGRLKSYKSASGIKINYSYNSFGDVSEIIYSDSTPKIELGYNELGLLGSLADGSGQRIITYHNASLKDEAWSSGELSGFQIKRNYNGDGHLSDLSLYRGFEQIYAVDYSGIRPANETITHGSHQVEYQWASGTLLLEDTTFTNESTNRLSVDRDWGSHNRLDSVESIALETFLSDVSYNNDGQVDRVDLSPTKYWSYSFDDGKLDDASLIVNSAVVCGYAFEYGIDALGSRTGGGRGSSSLGFASNQLNQISTQTSNGVLEVAGRVNSSGNTSVRVLSRYLNEPVAYVGNWSLSTNVSGYNGLSYLHSDVTVQEKQWADYTVTLPPGEYNLDMIWPADATHATNVPVIVSSGQESSLHRVNQTVDGGVWNTVKTLDVDVFTEINVRIATQGTDGVVIADAVRLVDTSSNPAPDRILESDAAGAYASTIANVANGYFCATIDVGMAPGPVGLDILVEGTVDLGSNDPAAVAEVRTQAFVAPTTSSVSYNADGMRQADWQWLYQWDGAGRLRSMDATAAVVSSGFPAYRLEFAYDAQGRRYKKAVYRDGLLDYIRYYIYDGWDLIAELDGDRNLVNSYVWGPDISGGRGAGGIGGLVSITSHATNQTFYPVFNYRGDVIALIDSVDGSTAATYEYGPFGEPFNAYGPAAELNPFRYSTKYTDVESGLVYFGYRYYDPISGTWLSREPLGEFESANLYAYCHNDPINHVDYLGLQNIAMGGRSYSNDVGFWDIMSSADQYHMEKSLEAAIENGVFIAAMDYDFNRYGLMFADQYYFEKRVAGVRSDIEAFSLFGGWAFDLPFWVVASASGNAVYESVGVEKGLSGSIDLALTASTFGAGKYAGPALRGANNALDMASFPTLRGSFSNTSWAPIAQGFASEMAINAPRVFDDIIPFSPKTSFSMLGDDGYRFGGNQWISFSSDQHLLTATNSAPSFKTWNQFQAGTKGQFASRADAGQAWQAYKQANGITTGAVRSQAQKSLFLRNAADSGNYPKWMNQWLQQGKVPPGYHVDHIKPLSIGGDDLPSNMRLLDIDMHKVHHQFYRPWE